jgi:hypothetical protein
MSIAIALYTMAIVVGIISGGGIIELSNNINTQNIQDKSYYMSMSSDFNSAYYPSRDNISIKLGESQTFSIYPNILTTYTLDGKKIFSGQTYEMFASDQNIGTHKLEVNNIINNKIWYISIDK